MGPRQGVIQRYGSLRQFARPLQGLRVQIPLLHPFKKVGMTQPRVRLGIRRVERNGSLKQLSRLGIRLFLRRIEKGTEKSLSPAQDVVIGGQVLSGDAPHTL